MKFSGNFLGKRGRLEPPTLITHTICSVGFLLYLCEMETKEEVLHRAHLNSLYGKIYNDKDKSYIHYEYMREIAFLRERKKMDGNRGIHIGYKDNEIQDGD